MAESAASIIMIIEGPLAAIIFMFGFLIFAWTFEDHDLRPAAAIGCMIMLMFGTLFIAGRFVQTSSQVEVAPKQGTTENATKW